jgi:hypothetical protein
MSLFKLKIDYYFFVIALNFKQALKMMIFQPGDEDLKYHRRA